MGNLYLIIPAICFGLWALISTTSWGGGIPLWTGDYIAWYKAGKMIWFNPGKLYDAYGYLYLPSFAVIFAFTFCFLPFMVGFYVFFIMNYILGLLIIREFNKILIIMQVKEKIHRFMFLIVISNGTYVFYQFRFNQSKFIVFVIFLFIIRRELLLEKEELEKDIKYLLINYGLFVFAIGIAPFFIFFLVIYIFHNLTLKPFFKRENVNELVIAILLFLIENFLFILFPSLIYEFISNGINHPKFRKNKLNLSLLGGMIKMSGRFITFMEIMSTIILSVISLILIFKKELKIEEKFGYFCLAYIFFGVFAYSIYISLMLFSFILILFIPNLNQNVKGIDFVKKNKFFLIGLLSIFAIFFVPQDNLEGNLFAILGNLPLLILQIILLISLIKLKSNELKF